MTTTPIRRVDRFAAVTLTAEEAGQALAPLHDNRRPVAVTTTHRRDDNPTRVTVTAQVRRPTTAPADAVAGHPSCTRSPDRPPRSAR